MGYPMADEIFARVAARYWADLLRTNAAPDALRDTSLSDEGVHGVLVGAKANALVGLRRGRLTPVTPEQADAFEEALANLLASNRYMPSPCVDYQPNETLQKALTAVGLDEDADVRFPWKTFMTISPDGVSVREGFRNERRYLVSTKRQAVFEAVRQALSVSDHNPYKHDEHNPTEAEHEAYGRRMDRLNDIHNAMDPMPPEPYQVLLARTLDAVVHAEIT